MGRPDLHAEYSAAAHHLWYGSRFAPDRRAAELSWKAVKAIAAADGHLSEPERLRLLGKMCAVATPSEVIAEVLRFESHSASAVELLAQIGAPPEARLLTGVWIIYEALGIAMADGDLSAGELEAARHVGGALGLDIGMVDALHALCREETLLRRRRIDMLGAHLPAAFHTGQTEALPPDTPLSAAAR
jgi:tellurite resistance protein